MANVLVAFLFTVVCAENCSTWLHASGDGYCICGSTLENKVVCNNETREVGVLQPYCLTSNGNGNAKSVVGLCLAGINHGQKLLSPFGVYDRVYPNLLEQDNKTCGYLNREGRLCSKCKPNHSLPAYSYDIKCYPCSTSNLWSNILQYICIAYLPLTVFLCTVLLFRISVTSPAMYAPVFFCQQVTAPFIIRNTFQYVRNQKFVFFYAKLLGAFYSIWNLDFFRTFLPPLCLPLNMLQITILDYIVAAYPLLLLICFYVLVTAHDRGCRLIVKLWKPFLSCAARLRQQWNVKRSIIDAFATFLVLSYIKFLNTSFDLLMFTYIQDENSSRVGTFLYYNATIDYLGHTHIPYAILATTILFFGNLFLLLLLLLYPMSTFQKCLNKRHLNSPSVQMFMQCFQGPFRDRTDGGLECRYFAALYPAFNIVVYIVNCITPGDGLYFAISIPFCIIIAVLIVTVQPYKRHYKVYSKVNCIMFVILGLLVIARATIQFSEWKVIQILGYVLACLLSPFPFVYFGLKSCHLLRRICKERCTVQQYVSSSTEEAQNKLSYDLDAAEKRLLL